VEEKEEEEEEEGTIGRVPLGFSCPSAYNDFESLRAVLSESYYGLRV
jgi:hypothetical protein